MTGRFPRRDLAMHVDEGSMLETLDYTIRIGSTPTFLYFDLYLYSAYAAHCIYLLLDPFLLYGNNLAGTFFVPSPAKRDNFYHISTHSVQLHGDDIMLTLQIKSRVKSSLVENVLMYTMNKKRPVSPPI